MKIHESRFRTTSLLLGSLILLGAGAAAGAQTCANPLPLPANTTLGFDTCTATNSPSSLAGWAYASPGPDVVYAFRDPSWRSGRTSGLTVTSADSQHVVLAELTKNQCSASASAEALDDTYGDGSASVSGWPAFQTDQQYYVIVSAWELSSRYCGNITIRRNATP